MHASSKREPWEWICSHDWKSISQNLLLLHIMPLLGGGKFVYTNCYTCYRLLHTSQRKTLLTSGKSKILTGFFCPNLGTDTLWRDELGIPTPFTQGLLHLISVTPPPPHSPHKGLTFYFYLWRSHKNAFIPEDFYKIHLYVSTPEEFLKYYNFVQYVKLAPTANDPQTTNDPQNGPQRILWKVEEWNEF